MLTARGPVAEVEGEEDFEIEGFSCGISKSKLLGVVRVLSWDNNKAQDSVELPQKLTDVKSKSVNTDALSELHIGCPVRLAI